MSAGPSSVAPPKPTPTTELHKGDRRVVTVLFTDVSGFTAMSERLDPEEVTGIVNRFFQVLTEPIYRYGGVVDKYLGDAIMALFGAPVAHEDDALRGVLAGWAMQQAASGFAEDLEGKTGIKLRVRVGLHTGLVVAGSVGGSQRADYTVTGETVTIASKMEAAAPPGGVLVSAETWRQVQGHFRGEPAATPPSASKDQPLAAWQILGPEHDEGPSLGGQDADVIGRLEEQKALATSWQSVLDGRPAGLILAGDVGSGKSLLLRQETRRFRQEGALVLWGRGVSFDRDRAHAVAASVLQPLLENRGPTPEEAFAALEGLVARWLPYNVPRSTSSLAHLLGLPVTHPEVASLSPQQRRSASFVVLDDLVIAMAREGPTVLVIDDVQWADAPSLAWLEGLLQRLEREAGTVRLLLLLATREPETLPGIFERHPTFRSIRLAPLAPEESSAFVTTLLQAVPESLSPAVRHLVDEVLGKAEGNPFYLKELIRAVQEAGVLVREGATWSVASSEGGFRLPSSVQGALAARLDQLDASPRQVLQVASVLGRTVEDPLLSVVLDRNADRDLADLVRLGFLYPMPEARHAFTQAVAQEVAYENLLLSARRDWHGKAARAIEERTVPGTPDRARVLAHHLGRAEQDGPATRYAFEAAEEARFAFGNEEAIRLYRQALEHFDRLTLDIDPGLTKAHILAGLATVLTVTGEVVLAQEGFLEALAHAPDDPDRGSWEAGLIRAIIRQGDTRGAIARCQRRIGEVTDPEEEATLRATLAEQLMTSGDLDQAEAQCQLALGLIRADLQPLVMADVMNILGNVASRRGRPEAIGYYQRMLTLVDEARDVPRRVVGLTNLAMAQELAGDWGAAADAYDRAHAICARIGDRSRSAHILNNLGGLRLKLGLLDEATEAIQGADTLYESLGNPLGRAACANFIGRIHLAREAPIEAIPCFEASVRLLEQAGAGTYAAEVLRGLGQALLLAERLETSREVLRKAASLAADAGQQAESAMIRLLEGRLLAAEGHLEAGLAQGKEALEDVRRHGHSLDKGQAMVHLAYLARQAGETREADTLLLGARDLFEGIRATQEIRRVEALLKQA
ncbi:MAG: adenylate/guanylate cyclase domain-containing protein [Candidatus Sericytochromatia bacterium]|nr:adenylate/guanylate cyclase domain-containing protein [Candidatus Sericytochromatia bacterium]